MKALFFHAIRQLGRDWRAGEIVALGIAVAIAVGAVTSVLSFSKRVVGGLERSAGEVIAADIKLAAREEIPQDFQRKAESLGLQTARIVSFPTVLFVNGQTLLSSVKGVSSGYPLRGALKLRTAEGGEESVAEGIPGPGELWADVRVLYAFNLRVGDPLSLGNKSFRLTKILSYEPDRGGQFFSFSPRLMINRTDLAETGLLGPSSRARYALLAAGSFGAVKAFRSEVENASDRRFSVADLESAQSQVGSTVETAREFIGLASLGSLLIAGIAIAVASRRYIDRRRRHAALLRCFGASGMDVLAIHVMALGVLAVFWGLLGAGVGYGIQAAMVTVLSQIFSAELPGAGLGPAATGVLLGVLILIGFSTPALQRLSDVSPIEILRGISSGQKLKVLWYALPVAVLLALSFFQTQSSALVLLLFFGIVASLLVMMLVSFILLAIMKALSAGVGVSWRFGLGRLYRDRIASTFQIAAIGLGLTVLMLLSVVRGQLFDAWESRTPEGAPNFFFANVQDHEKEALSQFFLDRFSATIAFTPMATGRLLTVNGVIPSAEDYPDPRTATRIEGNLNFSWAGKLPEDNRLVAGTWWDPDTEEPVVSLAQSWAEPLGVTVGDRIGVKVGAETIDARIVNIREVQWESFKPNFFVLFPPKVFAGAPHGFLSAIRIEGDRQKELTDLNRDFPTVNIVDIGAILAQVRRLLDLVSLALNFVFAFTLAAGAAVLYSVLQAGQDSRVRDVAMLKVLGCSQRRLSVALSTEFMIIALVAGLLSGLAAWVTGWVLAGWVFDIPYSGNLLNLSLSLVVSVIIVWIVSYFGIRDAKRASPQNVLRNVMT